MALVWVRANAATEFADYGARFQVDGAAPLAARMIAVGYWTVIPAPPVMPPDNVATAGDVDVAFEILRNDPTSAVVRALALMGGLTDPTLAAQISAGAASKAAIAAVALDVDRLTGRALPIGGGAYTAGLGDEAHRMYSPDGSAITVTLPDDATTSFTVGAWIAFQNVGGGVITLAGGPGVSVSAPDGVLSTRTVRSLVWAAKTAANTWTVWGDTAHPTAAPTPGRVAARDAAGRLQVAAPAAAADVATKGYADVASHRPGIAAPTANYTLALADERKLLTVNAAAGVTVTVPAQATVAWPAGAQVDVAQLGTGQVTIGGAAGVTLVSPDGGLTTRARYSKVRLTNLGGDQWLVEGDVTDAIAAAVTAATASATPNTVAKRDANGRLQNADPVSAADSATKGYVDTHDRLVPQVVAGTAYTVALTDAGTLLYSGAATATTFTVPPNSAAAFPLGSVIEVAQGGTGPLTIAPGAGVSVLSPALANGSTLRAQYSRARLVKVNTDVWYLEGDLVSEDAIRDMVEVTSFNAGWGHWGDTLYSPLNFALHHNGMVTVSGLMVYNGGTGAGLSICGVAGNYRPKARFNAGAGAFTAMLAGTVSDVARFFEVTSTVLQLRGALPSVGNFCGVFGSYPGVLVQP